MSNYRNMILGPKEPDEDNPKYKKMKEDAHQAGVKTAERLNLGKIAYGIQLFVNKHNHLFLGMVLSFVVLSTLVCTKRIYIATHYSTKQSAVKRENKALRDVINKRERRLHPSEFTK